MIIASFIQFFIRGGFFMILLLLCSIAALATIIHRAWALRRETVIPVRIWSEIECLPAGEHKPALARLAAVVRNDPSALARITDVAICHLEWPRAEAMEAVQTRARHEAIRMETGLVVLEVIVGIAPLLGLLGAVSGLVTVFGNLGVSEAGADPRILAKGVAEALNTTIAGLAIAIPSLIGYSYFSKKVETLNVEMESILGELLVKCYSKKTRRKTQEAPGNHEPVADEPAESNHL